VLLGNLDILAVVEGNEDSMGILQREEDTLVAEMPAYWFFIFIFIEVYASPIMP
jgi:hypothetical protein